MDDKLKGLLKKSFDAGYEKGYMEADEAISRYNEARINLEKTIRKIDKLKDDEISLLKEEYKNKIKELDELLNS